MLLYCALKGLLLALEYLTQVHMTLAINTLQPNTSCQDQVVPVLQIPIVSQAVHLHMTLYNDTLCLGACSLFACGSTTASSSSLLTTAAPTGVLTTGPLLVLTDWFFGCGCLLGRLGSV